MSTPPILGDAAFRGLADLMYGLVGLQFPDSKKSLISSRLAGHVQRLGLPGFDDYLALLLGGEDQGELQRAVDMLTTNETYFFREPAHFELLEKELTRERPRSLKVWSAASSFGDEAYSCAMLLADLQRIGRVGDDWSVLGTDISERVLHSAAGAVFPEDRLRHVSPERLKRFCLRGEGASEGLVMMQRGLSQRVKFGQLNLCQPVDAVGPFDVVFLRNVLIYFDLPTKVAVVDRVLGRLRSGGLFFIGTAEGRVPCQTPLQPLAAGAFRKI